MACGVTLLAGCPQPTGRTRGPLDYDSGPCAVANQPNQGAPCENSAAVCDYEVGCTTDRPGGGVQRLRCACTFGQWRCDRSECLNRLADGGLACPAVSRETRSFVCDDRQEGQTCELSLTSCPDGSDPITPCTCRGGFWQCEDRCSGGTLPLGADCSGAGGCQAGLSCNNDHSSPQYCTRACLDSHDTADERAQCSAGGTCITTRVNGSPPAHCQPRCAAFAGACRSGTVCTNGWTNLAPARSDETGCQPFCRNHGECPLGQRCNERLGQCSRFLPSGPLLEDGLPCNVPTAAQASPCKGECRAIEGSGTQGMCLSIVPVRGEMCPDDPFASPPVAREGDELGVCAWRRCDRDRCCPSGLVCEQMEGTGRCVVDRVSEPNIACIPAMGDAGTDAMSDGQAP